MAKKEKETKTNAMRILERLDIPFTLHEYEVSETGGTAGFTNGADVAAMPIAYSANPVKEYNPDYAAAIGFEIPEGYNAFTAP